jgi:uncharacterized protein (TIGR00369 family)
MGREQTSAARGTFAEGGAKRGGATEMKFPLHIPFVESLGFELHHFDGGHAELRVDLDDAHLNSWDVAHGGVLMTMLDVAMAHAARSIHAHEADFGPGVVTIEMKTSFMRPAEGRLRAAATLLHRSTTMAFCEASVFDDDDHLCAHATGTFKYLRKLPTKGRNIKALRATKEPST